MGGAGSTVVAPRLRDKSVRILVTGKYMCATVQWIRPKLNNWSLRDMATILKVWLSNSLCMATHCELLPDECHRTHFHQKHWFRWWLNWWRQAASYYMSQCWPEYVCFHGVTRQGWVDSVITTPRRRCRVVLIEHGLLLLLLLLLSLLLLLLLLLLSYTAIFTRLPQCY